MRKGLHWDSRCRRKSYNHPFFSTPSQALLARFHVFTVHPSFPSFQTNNLPIVVVTLTPVLVSDTAEHSKNPGLGRRDNNKRRPRKLNSKCVRTCAIKPAHFNLTHLSSLCLLRGTVNRCVDRRLRAMRWQSWSFLREECCHESDPGDARPQEPSSKAHAGQPTRHDGRHEPEWGVTRGGTCGFPTSDVDVLGHELHSTARWWNLFQGVPQKE